MRGQHTPGWALCLALALGGSMTLAATAGVEAAAAARDGQTSKSAPLAHELAQQLDQAKLEHIAARDPGDPTRFVGAMYFPGLQLITVAGKYSVPVLLNEKLLKHDYKDVYIDLSSASDRASRVTVEDLHADGLPLSRVKEGPPDSFDQGGTSLVFDFDWKKAKLSEDEYMKKITAADEEYAKLLTLLIAEVKKVGTATK
jgi:hypothetical protein